MQWRPNQQRRFFGDVSLHEFKGYLDLTLKAHGSNLDKTMLRDHAGVPEDDAARYLGTLNIVTDRHTDPNKPYRVIEDGENQGVVMLCNASMMREFFGGGQKRRPKFAGFLHTLGGQPEQIDGETIDSKYRPFLAVYGQHQRKCSPKQRVMIIADEYSKLFPSSAGGKEGLKKGHALFMEE